MLQGAGGTAAGQPHDSETNVISGTGLSPHDVDGVLRRAQAHQWNFPLASRVFRGKGLLKRHFDHLVTCLASNGLVHPLLGPLFDRRDQTRDRLRETGNRLAAAHVSRVLPFYFDSSGIGPSLAMGWSGSWHLWACRGSCHCQGLLQLVGLDQVGQVLSNLLSQ